MTTAAVAGLVIAALGFIVTLVCASPFVMAGRLSDDERVRDAETVMASPLVNERE